METTFDPKAGKPIPSSDAKRFIERFLKERPAKLDSYYFGAHAFQQVLAQPGVVGISVCNGVNDEGQQVMILVPVIEGGKKVVEATAVLFEFGQPCPPICL